MYEGAPDTPAWDRWWQIIEDYKVIDPVLRPDRDPGVHEAGRGVPGEARPVVAARARLGRRADQPRGVALVPRAHRRRHGADRRHLVADRDRPDHDHAAPRRDRPRSRGRRRSRSRASTPTSSTATATRVPARWRRLPRPQAAVAGDAARHLRRPGALQGDVLEPLPGHVLRGRRRQARRRRLPLAARPRRRRHERGRPPDLDDRGRDRALVDHQSVAEAAVVGKKDDDHRPGDLRVRHPQGRPASRPTRWPSSCASTSPRSSARSPGPSS